MRSLRHWRLYAALILLSAVLFKGDVIYIVAYAVLLSFWGYRWLVHNAFDNLEIRWRLENDRIFPGEEASLEVTVVNASKTPFVWGVFRPALNDVICSQQAEMAFPLGPGGSHTLRFQLQGRKRGVYPVGHFSLSIGGLFSLGEQDLRARFAGELVVYPRIRPLTALTLPSIVPFGSTKTAKRAYTDPARLVGVRDYRPGDSVRMVHWPATAHTGELAVKVLEPSVTTDALVFLNLAGGHLPDGTAGEYLVEKLLEDAAALLYKLSQADASFGLASNGADSLRRWQGPLRIPVGKGLGHLSQCLEACARLTPSLESETDEAMAVFRQTRSSASKSQCLVVITPLADDPGLAEELALLPSGLSFVIVRAHGNRRLGQTDLAAVLRSRHIPLREGVVA